MIIEVSIGKSSYKLSCQDSEKDKLLTLASKLNQKVNELALSFKNADEKTLLAIAALMLQEEVQNNKVNSKRKPTNDDEQDEAEKLNEQDMFDAVSENMENISDYIEKLTAKIQSF